MSEPNVLTVIIGDEQSWNIDFVKGNGTAEDLTGASAAGLIIKDTFVTGGTVILQRSTGALDLTLDIANSRLVADAIDTASETITPGQYVGEAFITDGASTERRTLPFTVIIKAGGHP